MEQVQIKVMFIDGDYLYTKFNGTFEEAQDYYVGKFFNMGSGADNMVRCSEIILLR